nr:MAG TPA: hypothetical protein [Bacteriophage sp.]
MGGSRRVEKEPSAFHFFSHNGGGRETAPRFFYNS